MSLKNIIKKMLKSGVKNKFSEMNVNNKKKNLKFIQIYKSSFSSFSTSFFSFIIYLVKHS
jgi:hypothetical protein